MGILAVVFGIPLVIYGGFLFVGMMAKKKQTDSGDSGSPWETRSDDQTAKLWAEVRVGSIGITLQRVGVESVEATTPSGSDLASTEQHLVCRLRIVNTDPKSIAQANGQGLGAKLTDELGNKYKIMTIITEAGIPAKIKGQIPAGDSIRIRSDETGGDVLVFERPVPAAKTLILTLSADRYGGAGSIRFEIPWSAWDSKVGRKGR
jgi:hypothetical protein